jgi:hypothetical protein
MEDGQSKRQELSALRQRLYERNFTPKESERTELATTVSIEEAPRAWGQPVPVPEGMTTTDAGVTPVGFYNHTTMPKKKRYRTALLLFGTFFFIVALVLSSIYMLLGGNTVSADNIAVTITGPLSIGGGETISLQISVTNQNTSAIQGANLIVRYPDGTQSPEEEGKSLQREAIPLENIEAGETVNVPVRAVIFGEEDEEKTIIAEVEYQLEGSNGVFFKEAEPLVVKINASPVTVSIESVERVAPGQPINVNFVVRSNSGTPLKDVVIRAEYPFGFEYTSAEPKPVRGQNAWLIDEIKPGETKTISVNGIVGGTRSDERVVTAAAGISNNTNTYELTSVFSSDEFTYAFEDRFIELIVSINSNQEESVVIEDGGTARVGILVNNTLEDTIYDANVVVDITGTALDERGVRVTSGFYDSIKNAILFDQNTLRSLAEIDPGKSVRVEFEIRPDEMVTQMPEINFVASVEARRVREDNASEAILGSEERTIKLASEVKTLMSLEHQSGPIPPVAEKLTQYNVGLRIESGKNDIDNGEFSATLPAYVSWLDLSSGDGTVTYNPTTRTVTWKIPAIARNSAVTNTITVGFLPSISQVGSNPTIISNASFKGTDRFTGTPVRGRASGLNTILSSESGYGKDNGMVRRTEEEAGDE